MYIYIHMYMCICIHIYIYLYIYICVYIQTPTMIHTSKTYKHWHGSMSIHKKKQRKPWDRLKQKNVTKISQAFKM